MYLAEFDVDELESILEETDHVGFMGYDLGAQIGPMARTVAEKDAMGWRQH